MFEQQSHQTDIFNQVSKFEIEEKLRGYVEIHPTLSYLQFIEFEVNLRFSLTGKGDGEFEIVNGFTGEKHSLSN